MRLRRPLSRLLLVWCATALACHGVSELPEAEHAPVPSPIVTGEPDPPAEATPAEPPAEGSPAEPPAGDSASVAAEPAAIEAHSPTLDERPPGPPDLESVEPTVFGVPPFHAWVASSDVYVIPSRAKQWPTLGVLRYGDRVHVASCEPDCSSPTAYAMLEPFGAVRLSHLRAMPEPDEARASGPDARFTYARVRARRADARAQPEAQARVVDRYHASDELVFRDAPSPEGWLQRPNGLWVASSDVERLRPSEFAGWPDPPESFVFVRRDTLLTHDDGSTTALHRYDRLRMERVLNGGRVRVEGGTVARADVRNGRARPRPSRVPADAKWIHIDLEQQVLTAYEGDRLVFATLVSTGAVAGTTQVGTFRVRRKLHYTTMKSSAVPGDEYFVEGIPHVQYFHGSVALHGAYWHDRFGTPLSHGCVNLSFADARRLFEWSPGVVPDGWRAVNPEAAYGESLWVRVERIRR